jgi:predicted nucleotidyltransferase
MNTLKIKVPQKELSEFCLQHHIRKLAFFGSVLRDDFTSESDIDVLVEFEPGFTPGLAFFDLQDELSKMLEHKVDLNTPGFISSYFREQVNREARVQYVQA